MRGRGTLGSDGAADETEGRLTFAGPNFAGLSPSSESAARRLRLTGRRDTKPELELRSALHRRGLRYRVDRPVLSDRRRRVDIVFGRARVAVFVDGCFWHGCPEHGSQAMANADFWRAKIEANVQRDRDSDRRLREEGWEVIRVWEHEDMERAAEAIGALVQRRQ